MGLKTGMYYLRREPVEHPVSYDTKGGFGIKNRTGPTVEILDCTSCSA
jgi:hypothetical protein